MVISRKRAVPAFSLSGDFLPVSIQKSGLEQRLLELCDDQLPSTGFRAVDLDCRVGPRSMIRVYIEKPGEPSVGIEDCARVSSLLGPLIDEKALVPGGYDLEVSSPGLDRRLRLSTDFAGVTGEEVKIETQTSVGGSRHFKGQLLRVEEPNVFVKVDAREISLPISGIVKAHRVWQFGKS